MSFRSIGVLADEVLREAELRSRAPSTAAKGSREPSGVALSSDAPVMGSMGGGSSGRGDANEPLLRRSNGGEAVARNSGKGKGRGAKPRQVQSTAWLNAREGGRSREVRPALVLIVCNDGTRAINPMPHRGASPAPVRVPSLRIVGGHRTVPM